MSDLIAVTGATGKIGRHVCVQALARGIRVRALVRNPDAARAVLPEGVELVQATFEDDDLASKFEGADGAYLMVPLQPDTVELGMRARDALESAGVSRAVRLSVISPVADSDTFLGRFHTALDADFLARGFAGAVVRPHSFMENLLGSAGQLAGGQLVGANGDAPTPHISASDVGRCVVTLLADDASCAGTHDLTGPETLNGDAVAEHFSRLLGREVHWVSLGLEEYGELIRQYGLPEMVVELVTDLARLAREGAGAEPTDGVERLTGSPPETLATWMERHRAVFAEAAGG